MLDEQDILEDLSAAKTPAKKEFYRQCILIVKTYDSTFLHKEKKGLEKAIRTYERRRIWKRGQLSHLNAKAIKKEIKELYKAELKEARRKLKGINYILDYGKGKKTSRSTTPIRRAGTFPSSAKSYGKTRG